MIKRTPGLVLDFVDVLEVFLLIPREEAFDIFKSIMATTLPYDISPTHALRDRLWDIIDTRVRNSRVNNTVKANLSKYVEDAAELFGTYEEYELISNGNFSDYNIRTKY